MLTLPKISCKMKKIDKPRTVKYYAVYNVSMNRLIASLSDDSDKDRASIYAAFNRIPNWNGVAMTEYDYAGCTVQYCGKVVSINTNLTTPQIGLQDGTVGTWYIVVVSNREKTAYKAWFGSVCPANCNSQGDCQTGADNYGTCKCKDGYSTLSCTKDNNNFLIEYIILIIIASLVLVSALLGLIAWAYMRRRSQYVEVR